MQQSTATIKKDDKVILENISIWFDEFQDSRSGSKDWHGYFNLSIEEWIEPGGPYQITLVDGRSGDILVGDVQMEADVINVMFQGSGGLA